MLAYARQKASHLLALKSSKNAKKLRKFFLYFLSYFSLKKTKAFAIVAISLVAMVFQPRALSNAMVTRVNFVAIQIEIAFTARYIQIKALVIQ